MRNRICLNGEWDFMPVYNVRDCLDIPEVVAFEKEKIRVPSSWMSKQPGSQAAVGFGVVDEFQPFNMFEYPEEWNQADTGVYRRKFVVPEDMQQDMFFLRFDGIAQRSRVYLNGHELAEWEESYLPLEIDITNLVKKNREENELVVVCTTYEEVVIPSGQRKFLGLMGSWFGYIARGIWQDVYLENRPGVHIDDIYVNTSVRTNTLAAKVTVYNGSESGKALDIRIAIYDGESLVKEMEGGPVKTEAGEIKSIDIYEPWSNARLWDPDHPHLYRMTVEIWENSVKIDNKTLRFGFREIWMEGPNFILNGVRINLRGDSWHFQGAVQQSKEYALNWYKMCRENGVNCIRLHAEPHPECYLEAADEAGMLIIDETAIYGSAKKMPADHPVYLGRCKRHIERLIKRDRNHPSIILWSLQNEMRWVDGRDGYKLHIPDMMRKLKKLDSTRPIILEGDNRLLSKENTEVESMHYNIDGTIAQWDRKKPLVFGEHGGWWYVCPQNSSAYIGLRAYSGFDECVEGIAVKEKLFVEYARRNEVSGISTFNFVHYMMKSMPAQDIPLEHDRLDTPGCKPRKIRKNSLTLNNGLLEDYPLYIPHDSMAILREAYKPVTILPSEYDGSFFDDGLITRNFDIYNDTLYTQGGHVEICVKLLDQIIYKEQVDFIQKPGERVTTQIKFDPPKVREISVLSLEAVLFHGEKEMHRLTKDYRLYPSQLKYQELDTNHKNIAYIGSEKCREMIQGLLPSCKAITEFNDILTSPYDVLVIGSYLNEHADEAQSILGQFTAKGGVVVQLEQFKFAPGDLQLVKQPFFSAHGSDPGHKVLKGLTDDDFIFWNPEVIEERPRNIIQQCFVKPPKGDVNMLLECSAGDFGDGGDLWTPLFEYGYKKGTVIYNQLEITRHYHQVPQACILLRNILEYAVSFEPKVKAEIGLMTSIGSASHRFVKSLGLEFEKIEGASHCNQYDLVIADLQHISNEQADLLGEYAQNGGSVLVLPITGNCGSKLERITEETVKILPVPTYHLKKVKDNPLTTGISICDLFGYEKVFLSPRMVVNRVLCENAIHIEGAEALLDSVTGTPWYDYYIRGLNSEFSRIALVNMNKEKKEQELSYLAVKNRGKGSIIVSQLSTDYRNEKDIRVYSKIISNLGGFVCGNAFTYQKSDKDYSVECFMTLPYQNYQDYGKAESYYTDKEYSLNNLGEGLYGWMRKVERDAEDGFIHIPDSAGRTYFLSCFIDSIEDPCNHEEQPGEGKCRLEIESNSVLKVWMNGTLLQACDEIPSAPEPIRFENVAMTRGINRFIIAAKAGNEDIKLRPVFKTIEGKVVDNIKYQLTIDEVDPK